MKDCNDFLTKVQKQKFADYEIDTDSEIAFHGTATDIFDFTSKCYINVTTLKALEKTIAGLIKASGKEGAEDEVQGLAKKYTNHKLITEVMIYIPVRDSISLDSDTKPLKMLNERKLFLNDNTRHMAHSYKALMRAI